MWPTPNLLQAVEVPAVIKAQGIPTQLRAVLLKIEPDLLLQKYVDAFQAAGFYIPPVRQQPQPLNVPMLTALDPERSISYTVILQPHGDGTTTAILGEANLALRDKPGEDVAPLFPGAKNVVRTEQESARVLAYEAPGTPEQVQAFYRDVLPKAGYAESEEPSEKGTFQKGAAQLRFLLKQKAPGQSSVVVIATGQ